MEDEMRREGLLLYGLESGDPISDFDIIGFSLGYEMTYSNCAEYAGVWRGCPCAPPTGRS